MSTRALEEALDLLTEIYREQVGRKDGEPPHAVNAKAELANIRKAARVLTDDEVCRALRHAPEEVHGAMALLAAIAKEAP